MNVIRTTFYRYWRPFLGMILTTSAVLSACMPVPPTALPPAATLISTETVTVTPIPVTSSPTFIPSATPSLTASPTVIPTSTPIPGPRQEFQAKLVQGVSAKSYLKNACQVISKRWDPQNSPPGTIVVPVMFHSIARNDRPITDDTTITEEYFFRFMDWAHKLGFQTITSAQLAGFLENNTKIPPLSMVLIVDDRKRAEYFDTYFIPYLKKYNWTVTNAWIAHPDTPAYLWKENEQFVPGGLVDFQAHGVIHNTPMDDSVTEAYIRSEIFGPIQPMIDHFGKRPIALIWPRGLFTSKAVQISREAGYQIGFTVYARGPILFNWIPQGAQENAAADPLMLLPRYWSTTAIAGLEEAVQVSSAAQTFYARQRSDDQAYFTQYCQGISNLPPP